MGGTNGSNRNDQKKGHPMVKIPIHVPEDDAQSAEAEPTQPIRAVVVPYEEDDSPIEEPIEGLAMIEPERPAEKPAMAAGGTGSPQATDEPAAPAPTPERDAYRDTLTHVDAKGDVRMVDVSDKAVTKRTAVAEGTILMHPETQAMVLEDRAKKGDVLACARVAGIMAAKRTSDLIPMCHPLPITKAKVEIDPVMPGERADGRVGFHVTATTGVTGVTGIEMEALTAASVACLTVYDMCKAVDRGMEIVDVRLLRKEGGRSGLWERRA